MLYYPSPYSLLNERSGRGLDVDRLSSPSAAPLTVNAPHAYPGQPGPLTSAPPFLSIRHPDGGARWDIGTRFGQRLRELRRIHKMTQLDMAVMLGIDRSYISEVECGKKGISLATLEVIALGFRVHLSELLRDL
jgi:DNA-binding XRE family transcriptional regulator